MDDVSVLPRRLEALKAGMVVICFLVLFVTFNKNLGVAPAIFQDGSQIFFFFFQANGANKNKRLLAY